MSLAAPDCRCCCSCYFFFLLLRASGLCFATGPTVRMRELVCVLQLGYRRQDDSAYPPDLGA